MSPPKLKCFNSINILIVLCKLIYYNEFGTSSIFKSWYLQGGCIWLNLGASILASQKSE